MESGESKDALPLSLYILLKEVNTMIKEALGFAIVFIGLAIGFRIMLGAAMK